MFDLNDIEEILNNSSSKYECLKELINLIFNDLINALYNEDIDSLNDLYVLFQDNIYKLDMIYDFNETNDILIKYNTLKNVINNIFNLNCPFVNLSHLQEILNE